MSCYRSGNDGINAEGRRKEMKIARLSQSEQHAYTLTEVLIAVGVTAVMLGSFFVALSSSFEVTQRVRENLRATQILVQRVETVRLYTWDQLRNVGTNKMFQTNFSEYYDPYGATNGLGQGVVYYGTIQVSTNPTTVLGNYSYAANVALVSVTLRWTNTTQKTSLPHERQFQTLVARSGMQKYVYGSQ